MSFLNKVSPVLGSMRVRSNVTRALVGSLSMKRNFARSYNASPISDAVSEKVGLLNKLCPFLISNPTKTLLPSNPPGNHHQTPLQHRIPSRSRTIPPPILLSRTPKIRSHQSRWRRYLG